MKMFAFVAALILLLVNISYSKQFYASNFEKDPEGKLPEGWELAFKGKGEAFVIKDPLNPANKVFSHSNMPKDQARHDAGGSMYVVGDLNWTDYIVEYNAYFPDEFYMGTVFRFNDPEKFYLFDRRSGGEAGTFDFWRRQQGNWTNFGKGKFQADPKQWYRFRLVIKGDTFQAYAKSADDDTPFDKMKPILEGRDASFKSGKFGLYGLIYIDDIAIGETESDLSILAVQPSDSVATKWGYIKSR